ncbi:ethanolamine utilization cobalamin adenosyltransferase [Salmonella enterica subsp. enterica]|uniref:Ethanolamine utilization cobalamin adenosyltransferase n=1 Tax=Salmonella enterica I TaxID=59201 RepID=A0A379WQ76_SALET|nr:ethanolamine utilization cobalamin adenosyltransferase [Salmonella enterica subsp. enterica]
MVKKPDTLTHLTADKMVAKSDPRLGFRAALDSAIALTVWLQIELAEPWQPWLFRYPLAAGATLCAPTL